MSNMNAPAYGSAPPIKTGKAHTCPEALAEGSPEERSRIVNTSSDEERSPTQHMAVLDSLPKHKKRGC